MEPSANLGPWELIKGQIAYDIYLFQCNVYIICTAAIQQLPVRWLWKGFAFLIDSHSLDRIPLFLFFVAIIYHQRIIIEFYRILLLEVMLVFPKKARFFTHLNVAVRPTDALLKDKLGGSHPPDEQLPSANVLGNNLTVKLITRADSADLSMRDGSVTFQCASGQQWKSIWWLGRHPALAKNTISSTCCSVCLVDVNGAFQR